MTVAITVNGMPREIDSGLDVQGLLKLLSIHSGPVAVEVNGDIVPRSQHADYQLQADDKVEIVQAIGGG